MEACRGVAGPYQFKPNGELKHKLLYFKHLVKDHYVYEQIKNISETNEAHMETCNEIDWDHDTIPNNMDACTNTTQEEIAKGIMLEGSRKGCSIDSDNDGIADYDDSCLDNTAAEIALGVDAQGCPVSANKNSSSDRPLQ
jgi:OOP family OmpA-OmpF porin